MDNKSVIIGCDFYVVTTQYDMIWNSNIIAKFVTADRLKLRFGIEQRRLPADT